MNRFKELRIKRDLSQSALAKDINVDQTAVSKWELGRSFPDMEIAIRVADYFGVSVDYLLGRDEQKKEPATDNDDGLSYIQRENKHLLMKLTPEQALRVNGFLQGLLDKH